MLRPLTGARPYRQNQKVQDQMATPLYGTIGCISSLRCKITAQRTKHCANLYLPDETTGLIAQQSTAWWSQTGSNRRPHACKARALPTELWPLPQHLTASTIRHRQNSAALSSLLISASCAAARCEVHASRATARCKKATMKIMVGLGRLELPTSRLSSARSNQLSYKPETLVCASCATARCDPRKHHRLTQQYLKTKDSHASASHKARQFRNSRTGSSGKKEKRRRRSPANWPFD
jgi:hypothetical protein